MKLVVVTKDGTPSRIDLSPPLLVSDGDGPLAVITDGLGVDYYFDKDGHYDGWGVPIPLDDPS